MAFSRYWLGLSLGLLGCGGSQGELAQTAAVHSKPIYVVSGGFFSCKMPWSEPINTYTFKNLQPLMASEDSAYVATCFNVSHDSIWYQTDADASVQAATPDHFYDLVADRVAAVGAGAHLVLVGHSWGGWLVMANAERLSQIAPVSYLATLDPISWPNCPPSVVTAAVFSGNASGNPDPDCTTAPPDLAGAFPSIATATTKWDQFYQDRFEYLHSGPIAAASTNMRLTFDGLDDASAWEAHTQMDRDARIFTPIGAALAVH